MLATFVRRGDFVVQVLLGQAEVVVAGNRLNEISRPLRHYLMSGNFHTMAVSVTVYFDSVESGGSSTVLHP